MCGIIGVVNKNLKPVEVKSLVRKIYNNQIGRGDESFGLAILNKGDETIHRHRSLSLKKIFESNIWKKIKKDSFIMFHHRLCTSTENLVEFAHPFISNNRKVALAHNGVVWNHMEYYKRLKKEYEFESEHKIKKIINTKNSKYIIKKKVNINDSEILLKYYEKHGGVTKKMYNMCDYFALLIIDKEKGKYIAAKGSNPLWEYKYKKNLVFSSEIDKDFKGYDDKRAFEYGEVLSVDFKGNVETDLVAKEEKKIYREYTWNAYERYEDEEEMYAVMNRYGTRPKNVCMGSCTQCDLTECVAEKYVRERNEKDSLNKLFQDGYTDTERFI